MLLDLNTLKNMSLDANDGEIGRCKDFLFDDRNWIVRYMVADTRKWLPGRKVLISPDSLGAPDLKTKRIPVELTKKRIKECPPLDADAPVSREYEMRWADYYGNPYWWVGPGGFGAIPKPTSTRTEGSLSDPEKPEEIHLRSVEEVTGYHIQAMDGEIGHVEDLLLDDVQWVVRYLIVDTRNWLPGRKVILASHWADTVSWPDEKLYVDLKREQVKNSPEYDPTVPPGREFEVVLYGYYGLPPYWDQDQTSR